MPYAPGEHFDASLIFRGIMAGGENLGGGIAEMRKKQEQAEAQAAGSMIQFQTLKQAKLLTPEEETDFHNGNANKKAAIVTAATPRLADYFRTQQEKRAAIEHQLNRDVQMQIAQMHYGDDGSGGMTPYQREQTRLREMDILRKQQNQQIPPSSRAIARGRLNAKGEFDNNYAEAATGDMAQIVTPKGEKMVMPWSTYQSLTNPPQQTSPSAPQAASGAAPVTPVVPQAPSTAIIEKGGHHYEVDHASKKVLRQID